MSELNQSVLSWRENGSEHLSTTASLSKRTLAFLIDTVIGVPVGFLLLIVVGSESMDSRLLGALVFAPVFLIKILRQIKVGQSFGQAVLRIGIASVNGRNTSEAITRNIVAFGLMAIPFMNLVNAISILFSNSNQGFHDRIAKTWVVDLKNIEKSIPDGSEKITNPSPVEINSELKSDTRTMSFSEMGKARKIMLTFASLVALFMLDQAIQNWELSNLVNKIELSEDVMEIVVKKRANIAVTYWEDDRWTDPIAVDNAFAAAARDTVPLISAKGAEASNVLILPWHSGLRNAQVAFRAHNDAWVDHLNFMTITGDEKLWSQEKVQIISNTFSVFCSMGPSATPMFDLLGLGERVEKICEG